MWIVYLRFDDQYQVDTDHVRTNNKKNVAALLDMAEQNGLTSSARLVEYATFYCSGTIKPQETPNSHFYGHGEFADRWKQAE